MRHVNSAPLRHLISGMPMARTPMPTALTEIAERLRLSREALGFSMTTMARLIGSPTSTWHNYESGIRRISLDQALRLKARTGLTLEWIYSGEIATLPPHLRDKIQTQLTKENKG